MEKVRKFRFWATQNQGKTLVTGKNKKSLRESITQIGAEQFKGEKLKLFEVGYTDSSHLASILMGSNFETLSQHPSVNVLSEYEA